MRVRGFETRRLVVRPLRTDDRETCIRTGRDSVLPSMQIEGALLTLSQLDANSFMTLIERRAKLADSDHLYLISAFLRDDGRFIGDTMFFDVFRDPYPRAEIGTVIASHFQDQGIGSELIAGTIDWGWHELGLHEIKGFIEDENPRSTVACLRSGFSLTTSIPISRIFQGEVRRGWPIVMRRPH